MENNDFYDQRYVAQLKDLIEKNPFNYGRCIRSKGFTGRTEDRTELFNYIIQSTQHMCDTNFEYSLKTKVFWVINNISSWNDKRVCCQICGKPIKDWNIIDLKDGYKNTCSTKCNRELFQRSCIETMKRKYGVENAFQIPSVLQSFKDRKDEIQAKRDQTRVKHFGESPGWNLQKSLETRRLKYGSAWNLKAVRETKIKKHGNLNWNNPQKNFLTKKKNGTTNTSAPEEKVFALLTTKFSVENVARQWKDEAYPFACDFFLKDSKTYIECNFTWTHGGHFFDSSSTEDQKVVQQWKAKGTKYYNNAIQTWTIRDLQKKKVAEENKINYKVFWTLEEAIEWISTSDQV